MRMMMMLCNENKAFSAKLILISNKLSVQHSWQSGFDGCVCVLDAKHTGYIVLVWVTSSFLLRFLIEWNSCVCGVQITFCSCSKTTISLIRMTICGNIYLTDIFVGHELLITLSTRRARTSERTLPIHTNTNILIRNVLIDFILSKKIKMRK